jgi:2-iminobutanoate/2-iminopropanoate deaminase
VDFISSHGTKAAGLPFSDAVKVGDILYLSGQIGNLHGKMELAPGGIEGQTRQMMENIARILNSNGRSFDDVFKCTVMLADMSKWAAFNNIYVTYFRPHRLPARAAFGANGLALGAAVEMECLAWAGAK